MEAPGQLPSPKSGAGQRLAYRLSINELLYCVWAKGLFVQLYNQAGSDTMT